MAKAIWKSDLSNSLVHSLPMGSVPLHAAYQDGNICVWWLVDTRHRVMQRAIVVIGTGWEMPDFIQPERHIGSCQHPSNGGNIWHVFDLGYLEGLKPFEQRAAEMIYDAAEKGGAYDQEAEKDD
jgi:hypothetical protein